MFRFAEFHWQISPLTGAIGIFLRVYRGCNGMILDQDQPVAPALK